MRIIKLISDKKQYLIGILIGILIIVPMVAYNSVRQSKEKLSATNSQPITSKTDDNKIKNEDDKATKPGVQSASAPSNSTNQKTSSINPTSSTSQAPSQSQTSIASPTELTTCIWADGPYENYYCPYNPPASWSSDFVSYPCTQGSGEVVPCPNYRDFTSINNQAYSTDVRGLCQFTINSRNLRRNVIVSKPNGSQKPDCLKSIPI